MIDIVKSAILLEIRGEAFYRKVAASTENTGIRHIFDVMAKEETMHANFLRKKYRELSGGEKMTLSGLPDESEDAVTNYVLSEPMKKQIAAAGFEAAAISAAIDMETKAIKLYSESAERATDAEEKKLFRWLADWESGHHKILYELDKDLKERIWNDNQFWPF